jgi:hypothetical protein
MRRTPTRLARRRLCPASRTTAPSPGSRATLSERARTPPAECVAHSRPSQMLENIRGAEGAGAGNMLGHMWHFDLADHEEQFRDDLKDATGIGKRGKGKQRRVRKLSLTLVSAPADECTGPQGRADAVVRGQDAHRRGQPGVCGQQHRGRGAHHAGGHPDRASRGVRVDGPRAVLHGPRRARKGSSAPDHVCTSPA